MTTKAIDLLQKHESGFFLVVEGGRIDHAHHDGTAKLALHELFSFDNAIGEALKKLPLDDTLIIGSSLKTERWQKLRQPGFGQIKL